MFVVFYIFLWLPVFVICAAVVVRGSSVEVDVGGVVDEIGVIIAISSICHFILLKVSL